MPATAVRVAGALGLPTESMAHGDALQGQHPDPMWAPVCSLKDGHLPLALSQRHEEAFHLVSLVLQGERGFRKLRCPCWVL